MLVPDLRQGGQVFRYQRGQVRFRQSEFLSVSRSGHPVLDLVDGHGVLLGVAVLLTVPGVPRRGQRSGCGQAEEVIHFAFGAAASTIKTKAGRSARSGPQVPTSLFPETPIDDEEQREAEPRGFRKGDDEGGAVTPEELHAQ